MKAYKVIKDFVDLDNNNHLYLSGDVYPLPGYVPSERRLKALLTGSNRMGVQFIKEDDEGPEKALKTFERAIPAPTISEAEIAAAPEVKKRGPGRPRKAEAAK